MAMKFTDNATSKIIAFDFDGCITVHNEFPKIGEPRRYAKEVIDLLHALGVKIVIWTCRDKSEPTRDHIIYDDMISMVRWLSEHNIYYDSINRSVQYAPWTYEARKVYAHMYVDDCGYGWEDTETILLDVMVSFMVKHLGADPELAYNIKDMIMVGRKVDAEWIKSKLM